MSHAVTVMVADDDVAVANAATKILRKQYHVVSPVTDLTSLEAALAKHRPDILFLDIMWASISILARLPALMWAYPEMRICMFSAHAVPAFIAEAMRAGACGYLTKLNMTEELVPAVGVLLAGGQYLSQELRDAVGIGPDDQYPEHPVVPLALHRVGTLEYWTDVRWLAYDLHLSERRAEVVLAVHDGCGDKAIGPHIGCSVHTAHTHLCDAYGRLRAHGVTNRATVAAFVERSLHRRPREWRPPAGEEGGTPPRIR